MTKECSGLQMFYIRVCSISLALYRCDNVRLLTDAGDLLAEMNETVRNYNRSGREKLRIFSLGLLG